LYALFLLRSTTRVDVDDQGLTLHTSFTKRSVLWSEVARVETDRVEMPLVGVALDALVLRSTSGKRLARLTSQLGDFPDLVRRVEAAVQGATGATTGDARLRRSRPMAILMATMALFFVAAGGFVAIDSRMNQIRRQLLDDEGRQVAATVVKHYLWYETPRLEYQFSDRSGQSFQRDTAVKQALWARLGVGSQVRVRYAGSHPDYNRLVQGDLETEEIINPQMGYLIAGLGALMAALFAAFAVLRWHGIDIDFNTKTGKFRLVRLGVKRPGSEGE
jgi:hypothetical protein